MITRITKEGYLFSVERDKTIEYYASHSLCDCEGCRNYYKQIKGHSPELEEFLDSFGIDISRPDEMPWFDNDGHIEYTPYYTVVGNIEKMDSHEIGYGDLNLAFYRSEAQEVSFPTEQTEPYFVIAVFGIVLPWALDTPLPSAPAWRNLIPRAFAKYREKT